MDFFMWCMYVCPCILHQSDWIYHRTTTNEIADSNSRVNPSRYRFFGTIFVDDKQNGEQTATDVQAEFFVQFVVFTESDQGGDNLKCALGVCYDLLSTVDCR